MSCITEILKIKGDREYILNGEIAIEGGGNYKDYEYLITFTDRGHRCGYVAISETHPLYKFHDPKYNYPDLKVHGGVTYFYESRFEDLLGGHKCTDKWIGFDAGHCYDLEDMETAKKYFGETRWVKFRKENPAIIYMNNSEHRSFEYMQQQCKNLIDQLIDKAA